MAERARRCAGAEGDRAPAFRQQLTERGNHEVERAARQAEADQHAGRQIEHAGRRRLRHHVDAGGVEQRARDDHPHRAEAVGDRARERLRRAIEQRLHRHRQREDFARPAVRGGHGVEKQAERRARPETDQRDQAAADDDDRRRAPSHRTSRSSSSPSTDCSPSAGLDTDQAGAAAGRTTGFSTIGRLITAERTPSRIESHHTTSYEPVRSNSRPPSQTPRKPPTW